MKKMPFLRMLVLSLLGFALTFSSNIQDPPLMTFKVRLLAANLPNTTQGILGAIGLLVAMAVQPIVGVFSDRASTKLGRRLPFMIGGTAMIAISFFILALAPSVWVLLLGVILIQLSSNILQGPWQALIPDLVPESQRGTASSLKAVMDIIATVVAGAVAGFLLGDWGEKVLGDYAIYAAAAAPVVIFIIFVTLTAIWGREAPYTTSESISDHPFFKKGGAVSSLYWVAVLGILIFVGYKVDQIILALTKDWINHLYLPAWVGGNILAAIGAQALGWLIRIAAVLLVAALLVAIARIPAAKRQFLAEFMKNTFSANFRDNPVFGWWFANKILFWGAFIAINAFLINFLADVIGMTPEGAQSFYGKLKVILGVALVVMALFAGWLSDRFGRKPVMLIAGLVAFAGTMMLLFVRSNTLIILAGAVIGMGIGAFLSASWALATEIVSPAAAARYLGIANIATCTGSLAARLLGGVLIDPLNSVLGSKSSGYLVLYGLAAICFLASALVITRLPNKNKKAA